jgi:hypothetical protein
MKAKVATQKASKNTKTAGMNRMDQENRKLSSSNDWLENRRCRFSLLVFVEEFWQKKLAQ